MPIQRIAYQGLSHRLAEETQLLAEEKWIVDALTKIRNQRNSLQIERLHLESMKAQLRIESEKKLTEFNEGQFPGINIPSVDEAQNQKTSTSRIEFEVPIINMDELCNEEELDLTVTQHLVHNTDRTTFDMEEDDDDDDDDDDENSEDVFIDMNMLMNGKQFKIPKTKGQGTSSWTSD